jgi:tripartite-type tricarboxylate transporter receptor subunit TctC
MSSTFAPRRFIGALCTALFAAVSASPALAQGSYPDHPIRMVLPFSAGGGTDAVGRIIAKGLSDRLKQQVVVDNRAGGGSTIGTDIVAKAAPDGYTMLFASAAHSFSPTVYKQLPYAQDDFVAIAIVNITPLMLTVHPSVPAKDLKSFIALLKANPGKYNFASSGQGTTLHIAAEHFVTAAGIKAVHVPYRGEAPAMTDLVSGQVSFMVGQASTAVPYVKSGRLLGLGVTTPKRLGSISEVPTLAEAGLPGFAAYGWNAILVPKGTPRPIIDKLNREINAVIASPEVEAKFVELGLDVLDPTTPETATAFITAETNKWAPVIRAAGVKGE